MKLYLWTEVLCDYTDGVMFALANSPEEARELIRKHTYYVNDDELNIEPKVIDEPFGFALYGGG